jgi:hypothetical protein
MAASIAVASHKRVISESMKSNSRKYLSNLPLKRIAIWALVLNALWEFGQCTVLYDMWVWGLLRGTVWMWGAIAGDVLIVLSMVAIATVLAGKVHLNPSDSSGWLALTSISFIASIQLEWLALYLDLWAYSAWMPTVDLFGFSVGLAPIAQITLLPPLSVLLGFRQTVTTSDERRLSVKQ